MPCGGRACANLMPCGALRGRQDVPALTTALVELLGHAGQGVRGKAGLIQRSAPAYTTALHEQPEGQGVNTSNQCQKVIFSCYVHHPPGTATCLQDIIMWSTHIRWSVPMQQHREQVYARQSATSVCRTLDTGNVDLVACEPHAVTLGQSFFDSEPFNTHAVHLLTAAERNLH